MTDEEMNKKMEFIVEHQAKFAAELEMLRDVHTVDIRRLTDGVLSILDVIGTLVRAQVRTDESINRLTEALKRTDERLVRTDERLAQTDGRLNIFINVVERYISGNGGAESPA
jgi:ABC-type transporter Mla subunit MlaD